MNRFCEQPTNDISPTGNNRLTLVGFHIITKEFKEFRLNLWDIGGQKTIREFWRNYFEETDGVVWVVDSSDRRRMEDCRNELHKLLKEEQMIGASLLVMANKQDIPSCLTKSEIYDILNLESMKTHNRRIFECSAITGENVEGGFEWLVSEISNRIFFK